jgi:lipid-A-disaccharide synthase
LNLLLNDPSRRAQLEKDYDDLKKLLSEGGNASANAAGIIFDFLKPSMIPEKH